MEGYIRTDAVGRQSPKYSCTCLKVVDTVDGKEGRSHEEGFDVQRNVNKFTQLHASNTVVILNNPFLPSPLSP